MIVGPQKYMYYLSLSMFFIKSFKGWGSSLKICKIKANICDIRLSRKQNPLDQLPTKLKTFESLLSVQFVS